MDEQNNENKQQPNANQQDKKLTNTRQISSPPEQSVANHQINCQTNGTDNSKMTSNNTPSLSPEDQALLKDESAIIPLELSHQKKSALSPEDQALLKDTSAIIPLESSPQKAPSLSPEDQALLKDKSRQHTHSPTADDTISPEDQALLQEQARAFQKRHQSGDSAISHSGQTLLKDVAPTQIMPNMKTIPTEDTSFITAEFVHPVTLSLPSTVDTDLTERINSFATQLQLWAQEQITKIETSTNKQIQEIKQKFTEQWQDQLEHAKEHLRTRWREEFQYNKDHLRNEWINQQLPFKQTLSEQQTTISQIQTRLSKIQVEQQQILESWDAYQDQMSVAMKKYNDQITTLLQQIQQEFALNLRQTQQQITENIAKIQSQIEQKINTALSQQQNICQIQEQLQKRLGNYSQEVWQVWHERIANLQMIVQKEFAKIPQYLNKLQDEQIKVDQQFKKRLDVLEQQLQQIIEINKNFQHDLTQQQNHSVSQLQFWTTIIVCIAIYVFLALIVWMRWI